MGAATRTEEGMGMTRHRPGVATPHPPRPGIWLGAWLRLDGGAIQVQPIFRFLSKCRKDAFAIPGEGDSPPGLM